MALFVQRIPVLKKLSLKDNYFIMKLLILIAIGIVAALDKCESGKVICKKCANTDTRKLSNGSICSADYECESRYCEGRFTWKCKGRCRAKRPGGKKAWCDRYGCDMSSCRYGKIICDQCAYKSKRINKGHCSFSSECDGWCTPRQRFRNTRYCRGQCIPKK